MKRLFLIFLAPLFITACNSQNQKSNDKSDTTNVQKDTVVQIKPKVDIKVNRKYDDKGNLVGYDSTYMWSYSNPAGDTVSVKADSVLTGFRPLFDQNFPGMINPSADQLFFNDSTLYYDFLEPDYFFNRWDQQYHNMYKQFRQMDSLKQNYFKKHFPNLQKIPDSKI